eukprot:g589.t1
MVFAKYKNPATTQLTLDDLKDEPTAARNKSVTAGCAVNIGFKVGTTGGCNLTKATVVAYGQDGPNPPVDVLRNEWTPTDAQKTSFTFIVSPENLNLSEPSYYFEVKVFNDAGTSEAVLTNRITYVEEQFDTAARQSHGQVTEAKQSLEASDKALASAIAARKQTQTVLSAKGTVKDEGAQAQRSVVDAVQEYREVEVQIEAQRKTLLTFIEQTATDSPLAEDQARWNKLSSTLTELRRALREKELAMEEALKAEHEAHARFADMHKQQMTSSLFGAPENPAEVQELHTRLLQEDKNLAKNIKARLKIASLAAKTAERELQQQVERAKWARVRRLAVSPTMASIVGGLLVAVMFIFCSATVVGKSMLVSRVHGINVGFTSYTKKEVVSGAWEKCVVYMHTLESTELVRNALRRVAGAEVNEDAEDDDDEDGRIPTGSQICIVPNIHGVRANPKSITMTWEKPWHALEFELKAAARPYTGDADGGPQIAAGTIDVICDGLWIGAAPVSQLVVKPIEPGDDSDQSNRSSANDGDIYDFMRTTSTSFGSVAVSYSDADQPIVQAIQQLMQKNFANLKVKLHPLQKAHIDAADMYQLCWSDSSKHQAAVEKEWKHALATKPADRIRVTYWQQPRPALPLPLKQAGVKCCFVDPVLLVAQQTQVARSCCEAAGSSNAQYAMAFTIALLDFFNIPFTVMSLHTALHSSSESLAHSYGIHHFSRSIRIVGWITYVLYVVRTLALLAIFCWASLQTSETVAASVRRKGCLASGEQRALPPRKVKENFLLSAAVNSFLYIPLFIFFGDFSIEFERISYDFGILGVVHLIEFVKISLSLLVNFYLTCICYYGGPNVDRHHIFLFSCIFTMLRLLVVLYAFFYKRLQAKISRLRKTRAARSGGDRPELLYHKTEDGDLDVTAAHSVDEQPAAVQRRLPYVSVHRTKRQPQTPSNGENQPNRRTWASKEAKPRDARALASKATQSSMNERLSILWEPSESRRERTQKRSKRSARRMPVRWELWDGIWGSDVAAFTSNPSYRLPSSTSKSVPAFALPVGYPPQSSGSRLTALLVPPMTGDYTFFVRSIGGETELWFGSSSVTRCAQRASIGEDGSYKLTCALALQAGSEYVMQVLYKCGETKSGHLAVSVRLPDGAMECPLSSNMLQDRGLRRQESEMRFISSEEDDETDDESDDEDGEGSDWSSSLFVEEEQQGAAGKREVAGTAADEGGGGAPGPRRAGGPSPKPKPRQHVRAAYKQIEHSLFSEHGITSVDPQDI